MDWVANKVTMVTGWNVTMQCIWLSPSIVSPYSLAKVYRCYFWMMLHGAGSPKPTVCYSNMKEVEMLYLGALRKDERERRTTVKTTRHFDWFLTCACMSKRHNMSYLPVPMHLWSCTCINSIFGFTQSVAWGKYVDSKGKKRFVGTPELRASQSLGVSCYHIDMVWKGICPWLSMGVCEVEHIFTQGTIYHLQ